MEDAEAWESPPEPRRRRLGGVVAVLALVAVVAWLVRSPATAPPDGAADPDELAIDGDPTAPPLALPTPTPSPVPTPTPTDDPNLLGLDRSLPVVEGTWADVPVRLPEDRRSARAPLTTAWDGDELLVLGDDSAAAYDPADGTWQVRGRLPASAPTAGRRTAVGVARGVALVQEDLIDPRTGPRLRAWWFGPEGGWRPLADPPTSFVVGATDDAVLLAGRPDAPADQEIPLGLTALPVDGSPAVEVAGGAGLDMAPVRALPTADGIVVLGVREDAGTGGPGDDTGLEEVAARWTPAAGWTPLPPPPGPTPYGAGVWVPGDGPSAGRVLTVSGGPARAELSILVMDLDTGTWAATPVPLDDGSDWEVWTPPLTLAWDGASTVWVYGGPSTPLHLAYELDTGALAVARSGPEAVQPTLVWTPEGLVLGGTIGPDDRIALWTPADPAQRRRRRGTSRSSTGSVGRSRSPK